MGRSFSGSSGKNVTPPAALNASVLARFDRSAALNCAVKGEVVKNASLNAFTELFNTFTLSAALNASVINPSPLLTGLVSYWKLDGNSSDAYGSNNGIDQQIVYSALNGRINSGANGSGANSYINCGTANLNLLNVSISCWVKMATDSYRFLVTRLVDNGGSSSTYELRVQPGLTVQMLGPGGGGPASTIPLVIGIWSHVVATRSSSGATVFYIDGVQRGSGAGPVPTSLPSSPTLIGTRGDGYAYMNFAIDEVGIWNRVLTQSEVTELYSLGSGIQYDFNSSPLDSWDYTGAMVGGRYLPGVTVLTNQKVLAAAGYNAGSLATAELYDPSTETWASTGSRATSLYGPGQILLPSGKALAAGGYGSGLYQTVCELYDPVAGTWASTGSMSTTRYRHALFLLSTGKVLALGGENPVTAVTELYDPAAGTWANTGSMGAARAYSVAVRLNNGKVLVAGGSNATPTVLSSAELYDPDAGTWSATGSMAAIRRAGDAVVLQSGKVLIAGGHGADFTTMVLTAELYDPALGTWSSAGSLTQGRDNLSLVLLSNGKVIAVGGRKTTSGGYTDVVEMYDPTLNSWSVINPMSMPRAFSATVLLPSGKVLMGGGWNGITAQASSELFTPATHVPSTLLSGLSAYWKLDGNPTDALGAHNGTNGGNTYSTGKIGQGSSFSSSAAINFTGIPLGTNFTTACWVNPTAIGSVKGLVTDAAQGAQVGVWGVYILASGAVSFYDNALHNSTGLLSASAWQHVVVTHDGTTIRFYLNGALDPSSYAVASTFAPSKLGNDTFNQYLNGAMDEVGIWDRALSLAEIQQLYRLGIGLPYPF